MCFTDCVSGILLDFGWALTSHLLMHNEGVFKVRKTSYVLGRKEAKSSFSDALCASGSLHEEQLD